MHIIRFLVLMAIQIVLLNNIRLFGYFNPYLYLVFLLLLPVHIQGWLAMIIGFVCGLVLDFFTGTLGLHAASCTLACAVRPILIDMFHNRKELKKGLLPEIGWFGIRQYILFSFLFVLIHHVTLFYLDAFSFHHFFRTFLMALINTVITTTAVVLYQLIFHGNPSGTN